MRDHPRRCGGHMLKPSRDGVKYSGCFANKPEREVRHRSEGSSRHGRVVFRGWASQWLGSRTATASWPPANTVARARVNHHTVLFAPGPADDMQKGWSKCTGDALRCSCRPVRPAREDEPVINSENGCSNEHKLHRDEAWCSGEDAKHNPGAARNEIQHECPRGIPVPCREQDRTHGASNAPGPFKDVGGGNQHRLQRPI